MLRSVSWHVYNGDYKIDKIIIKSNKMTERLLRVSKQYL